MPIVIENIGFVKGYICEYRLRINDKIITTFRHDREDGLSECLKGDATSVIMEQIKPFLPDGKKGD